MNTNQDNAADPLWITVNTFKARYQTGHTKTYELLGKGLIEARKLGGKTLINRQSADRYFGSLPMFGKVA